MRTRRHLMTALLRGGIGLAAAALVGLHLQILWSRLVDGSVLDPVVAGRWLGALVLGLILFALRRRGVPLARGRAALVVWLLVALLHAVGLLPAFAATVPSSVPAEIIWIATPLGFGAATLGWAAAFLWRRSRGSAIALLVRRLGRGDRPRRLELLRLAAVGPRAPPA